MNTLLLVDADPRTLNVLGVSLKQAGYEVTTATDGLEALAKIDAAPPQLLVTATRLQKLDGYDLVGKLRDRPETSGLPIMFLATEESPDDRRRARELGVEDYVKKPVYVREFVARVKLLLARHAQQDMVETPKLGRTRLGGCTQDVAVVDIVQNFEASGRSGVVHLQSETEEAHLYFRDGRVIDAELGALHGEEAVYRSLGWVDARFEVELKPVMKKDLIGCSTQTLVRRGMQRLGESVRPQLARGDRLPEAPRTPAVQAAGNSRSSSAPVTREIDAHVDHLLADATAAGLPSTDRWAKGIIAVSIAGAAALVFAAGLRSVRPWLARDTQGARIEATAAAVTPPPKAVEAVLPIALGITTSIRAEVTATAATPEAVAPSSAQAAGEPQPARPEPAAAPRGPVPEGREAPLDVRLAATNLSPLVRDAQRALLHGDTQRALSLARQAVGENEADAEAWLTLAAAQRASGDLAAAGDTYRDCASRAQTAGVHHCRILASNPSLKSPEPE